MLPPDTPHRQSDEDSPQQASHCNACESALAATGKQTVSFLLLDQLRVPLIGCDDHRERFAAICGLTTDDAPDLLSHQPAGGMGCPGCRLAPHNPSQPVLPVQNGAVAVLACPEHQTEVVNRFQTGLDIEGQLTATLE